VNGSPTYPETISGAGWPSGRPVGMTGWL
jgi:hypothetical protein